MVAFPVEDKDVTYEVLRLIVDQVEVITEELKLAVIRRIREGSLTPEEVDRLEAALLRMDLAIEDVREAQGISESVKVVSHALDDILDRCLAGPQGEPDE